MCFRLVDLWSILIVQKSGGEVKIFLGRYKNKRNTVGVSILVSGMFVFCVGCSVGIFA